MLDRFREILSKVQRQEDADFLELAAFLEARLDKGGERLAHWLATLDLRTHIALACIGTGLATTLISATAVGSGYFMRLGILLLGVGLHQMLRR